VNQKQVQGHRHSQRLKLLYRLKAHYSPSLIVVDDAIKEFWSSSTALTDASSDFTRWAASAIELDAALSPFMVPLDKSSVLLR